MKFRNFSFSVSRFSAFSVSVFCGLMLSASAWGQTSTQNFGTGTGSNTSQTGSTVLIPNPTSGTTYARGGAVAPNAPVVLATTSNPLGTTGTYVRAVSSSSASVTKMSPIVSYTSSTEFYTSFKVLFGDSAAGATAASGIWTFYQGGPSTNYIDNVDVATANVFTGLRFTFGGSGALTLTYNNNGTYNSTGLTTSAFSQATVYTVEIIGNNKTSGTISYTYNGVSQTVAVQKFDLYINGTKIGDDLTKGTIVANTAVDSITFTGVSSTSNAANLFVDDVVVFNSVPASIGATTTNFYSKSSGANNLETLSNWGTNTDGTGTAPANFTAAGQIFNIRNNATPTIGAAWTVSGSGSKIIVGDGTNACNFTIPSSFAVTGTVDVSAAATLTSQNTANPTLGTLSGTSTVDYNGTGNQTVAAALYGNLTISGTRAATPTITLASGTIDVSGTFSVTESGAVTYVNTGNTVNFSSASAQTIPAINYLNVTNTGNGNRTLASSGTIGIAGSLTTGSGTYTVTGSTVQLNATTTVTIGVPSVASGNNFNILTANGSGGTFNFSSSLTTIGIGTLNVQNGTLVLNTTTTAKTFNIGTISHTGGTLDNNSSGQSGLVSTLKVSGDYTQSGSALHTTSGAGTALLQFNGGATSTYSGITTFTGNLFIFTRIQISNNTVLNLSTDLLINGFSSGTTLTVDSGSTLNAGANLVKVNNTTNTFAINGICQTSNSNGFSGSTSTTIVSTNSPTVTLGSASTIDYTSAGAQTLTGRTDYANVTSSGGGTKTLGAATTLSGALALTSGKVSLSTFNLTIGSAGSITGASSSNYIVTGSTGRLVRNAVPAGATTFPVGPSTTSYTPLSLASTSGAPNISVGVGSTITNAVSDSTRVVNLQWSVTANTGTPTSNITFQYNAGDGASNFDANASPIDFGNYTTSYAVTSVTPSGSNPYTLSKTGLAIPSAGSNLYVIGNTGAITAGVSTPPTLAAAVGATVDTPFVVTFTDDSAWRAAITSITVDGITLTAGSSVTAGQITFTPSASSPANLLQAAGTKSIVVIATGYSGATVSQAIGTGAFTKLQTLVPGESAAPGTATGKSGSPTARTAGTAFNITANAVDQYWNGVTSTDTVAITSSDANATLPANAALVAGTKTFSVTLNTAGSATVTATDASDGSKTASTSSSMTVNAGAFTKMQLLVPGETAAPGTATGKTGSPSAATAGTQFSVTVNAVDANWNVATSTDTVAITSSDANATLPSNAALVAGTKSFNVTFKTAGSRTITASDLTTPARTANTSPSITVNAGAFTKLQTLVPGETAAPGTATGKTGSTTGQTAGSAFNVTVNGVDANFNVVSSVTDTVAITSSDTNATLPSSDALVSGTKTFSVTLNTAGSKTVTATDSTDGTKTANTSAAITVSAGAFTKLQLLVPGETASAGSASGKTGTPSAQTDGAAFNVIVNAVDANWNVVSNTDTITVTSSDGAATLPAPAALVAGTKTFSVTLNTVGSATVTATDTTNGGITANTSPSITVNQASQYRSKTTGNWNAIGTWEVSTDGGSNWADATVTPTSADGAITIRNTHTVTINATGLTIDQVTVQSGGNLTMTSATTISNGTGDDVIVQSGGTFVLGATPTFNASATSNINTGGTLKVTASGLTGAGAGVNASNFVYQDASILEFANGSAVFSSGGVTYFPNVDTTTVPIFRVTAIGGGTVGAGTPTVFNGVFEPATGITISWAGAGTKTFRNGIRGGGDVSQGSAAQFIISGATAELGGAGTLTLGTNGLSVNSPSVTTLSANKTVNTGTLTVASGATLNCGASVMSGSGTFALASGGTLGIGSTGGIASSGATGNIQTTARSFSSGANYTYNGTAAQVTGVFTTAPTASTVNNLTIANIAAAVSLSASETVSGTLTVTSSANLDFNSFTITTPSAPSFAGALTMEVTRTGGNTFTGSNLTQTAGTLTYGGTVTVNLLSGTLAAGDSIPLFASTGGFGGGFTSVTGPTTPGGLTRDVSQLTGGTGGNILFRGTPTLSITNSPVTYTGSAQAATVVGSVPGTVSDVKYDGSSTVPTNAGTYAVTADFTPTDTATYNSLNDASAGNFVISKATPTISVTNSPVTYNGSPQSAAVSGSVAGTASNVMYDGSPTSPTNVGTYAITADFTPDDATNYNSLTGASAGNFVIDPKPVTVTANSGQTKIKGASDPTFTYTVNTGDTLTGALSRTSGETPGTYTITQGTITNGNNPNFSITFISASFVIRGPLAAADSASRQQNSENIKIPIATLLSNDTRIASNGSTQTDSLSITGVTPGTGNSVTISGAFVFYTPSDRTDNTTRTFTYTITDSVSGATDTATVTVTTVAAAPFKLEIVDKDGPTYDSDTDETTIVVEFVSVPNQSLFFEYSPTNMSNWTTAGIVGGNPVATGASGTFAVTITVSGDQTSAWSVMFFRATRN